MEETKTKKMTTSEYKSYYLLYKEIIEEIKRRLDVMQYKPHKVDAFHELKDLLNFIESL